MQIEIVSIGSELLRGSTINTNAAAIGQFLQRGGYLVTRQTALPDDLFTCKEFLQEALDRSALLITTGGLGPTLDDITCDILSKVCKTEPQELQNKVGCAPGLLYKEKGAMLIALPGVPKELDAFLNRELLQRIKQQLPLEEKIFSQEVFLGGKTEKEVDSFLRKMGQKYPKILLGIYPRLGLLQLTLSTRDSEEIRAHKKLTSCVNEIKEAFPYHHYEATTGQIGEAIHKICLENGFTLAFAESCTGGALAEKITKLPGASSYFLGSIVAYANRYKQGFLEVNGETLQKNGAVSLPVVQEMTGYLRQRGGADCVISVSGVAGPGGGSPEKPVGTVALGIAVPGEEPVCGFIKAPTSRASSIEYTCNIALFYLWQWLAHHQKPVFHHVPIT